jgi:hypothetical protein
MPKRAIPHRISRLVFLTGVLSLALGAALTARRSFERTLPPEHPLFGR